MMITYELSYSERTADGYLCLHCAGVGVFPVFSGLGAARNVLEMAGRKNGPIPLGKYWISDRLWGGPLSVERTLEKYMKTKNHYWDWFSLYRQDGAIDDETFVEGQKRNSFRLHPLRPDGTGDSDGCVTFRTESDFNTLRHALLRTSQYYITCNAFRVYGELIVSGVPYD